MGSKAGNFLVPILGGLLGGPLGGALSSGLGLGLGSVGSNILGGALTGGLGSAFTGGNVLTGALTGGLGSGLTGYLGNNGGISGLFGGDSGLASGAAPSFGGEGINWNPQSSLGSLTSGSGLSTGGGSSSFGAGSGNNSSLFDSLFGGQSNPIGSPQANGMASSFDGSGINWNAPQSGGSLGGLGGNMGSNFKLGDLLGGLNSYSAQNKLAQQQKNALNQAMGVLAPYQQTGSAANTQLSALLGLSGPDASHSAQQALLNNPGYQFRLNQGQDALSKNLSSQGLLGSGTAVKASNDYAQGQAQNEYQDAIHNLMGASGQGMNAGSGLASMLGQIGQVGAAETGQQSNIINQGLAGIFGSGQNNIQQLLSQLMRSSYG